MAIDQDDHGDDAGGRVNSAPPSLYETEEYWEDEFFCTICVDELEFGKGPTPGQLLAAHAHIVGHALRGSRPSDGPNLHSV